MATLLDSGKYSDLRIVCREESWNVHRNIISPKSSVFERMIDAIPKAANPGTINLSKNEPKIVEKMLRFIYQDDYDDGRELYQDECRGWRGINLFPDPIEDAPQSPARPRPNGEALLVNIKVVIIAGKFGMKDLMDLAVWKHMEATEGLWDTPNFARSIPLLYDSEMDEVRRQKLHCATVNVIANNAPVLLENKKIQGVLNRYGELATEVLLIVVKGEGWMKDGKRGSLLVSGTGG